MGPKKSTERGQLWVVRRVIASSFSLPVLRADAGLIDSRHAQSGGKKTSDDECAVSNIKSGEINLLLALRSKVKIDT